MGFYEFHGFMNSSLDVLVKNLSDNDFKYLSKEFSEEFLELVKQIRVYLYEYINSLKGFLKRLPDRHEFYSSLMGKCISDKDYLDSVNVWNMSDIKAMGDYHDLYLKTRSVISGCL